MKDFMIVALLILVICGGMSMALCYMMQLKGIKIRIIIAIAMIAIIVIQNIQL